jgi:hypothetical protein
MLNDRAMSTDGADGAVEPKWARRLPYPIHAALRFLYLDQTDPRDSFITSLQKCIIGLGAAITPFPLIYPIYNLIRSQGDPDSGGPGYVLSHVAIFGYCALWIITFALLRCNKHIAGKLIVWWFFGTALGLLLRTISMPHYPTTTCYMQLAIVVLSAHPKHNVTLIVICVLGYLLSGYNTAVYLPKDPVLPLATVPRPFLYTNIFETMRDQIVVLVLYGLILLCVLVQCQESRRQVATAKASAVFAQRVAMALSRYDTDAAALVLEAAQQVAMAADSDSDRPAPKSVLSDSHSSDEDMDPSVPVDPALLATFETIIENLRRYRPHLPNWVVQNTSGDDRDDNEPVNDSVEQSTRHSSSLSARPSVRSARYDDLMRNASPVNPMSPPFAAVEPVKARVSLARLDFGATAGPGQKAGPITASATHAFVDRVHAVAAQTHAAVHCFVGDRLITTWNAAKMTTQAEVKAGRFLSRLLQDSGDPAIRVYGIATSFSSRVQLAGWGKQSALLVGADPNDATVAEATRLASTYRTIVVNGALRKIADHAITFRGVGVTRRTRVTHAIHTNPAYADAARLPGSVPRIPSDGLCESASEITRAGPLQGLFEVRGERNERDEGWVYVIETEGSDSPDAQLCQAVDFAVQGHYGIALTTIHCMNAEVRAEPIVTDLQCTLRAL